MNNLIEKKAILIGLFANLLMALCGWLTFHISGSEAILLDGNFSFILCLTGVIALIMYRMKSAGIGREYLDSVYTFIKGGLILSVIFLALVSSVERIYYYWIGCYIKPIETGVIAYYVAFVILVCLSLACYYYLQNKKINFKSNILKTETITSTVDGVISSGAGIALILIGYIDPKSVFSFMLYIGDSIAVLILATLMIKTPIKMIIESYRSMTFATA